jgi:hypothetical protein
MCVSPFIPWTIHNHSQVTFIFIFFDSLFHRTFDALLSYILHTESISLLYFTNFSGTFWSFVIPLNVTPAVKRSYIARGTYSRRIFIRHRLCISSLSPNCLDFNYKIMHCTQSITVQSLLLIQSVVPLLPTPILRNSLTSHCCAALVIIM